MHRKRSFVLAFAIFMALSPVVTYADPLRDELKNNQQQLNQVQDKREAIEAQLQTMDEQIIKTMEEIKQHKEEAKQIENETKDTETKIVKAQEDVTKQQELMNERLREIYKHGQTTYLSVVLEAKGFGDLISRIEAINKMANYDKKIMADLKDKQGVLEKHKNELAAQKAQILQLQKDSENKLQQIKDSQVAQTKLNEELKAQEKIFAAKVKQSQALVDAAEAQIRNIRSQVPKYDPSRGAVDFSANAVVAYASNFLGTPYVYGGSTPDPGFDCSGFVKYVYAHFGVNLPRTTDSQIYAGYEVSRADIQPGDLILFGTKGDPRHVGMYVGNNCYIHSPQTGDVVKVSALTRTDILAIRRVK